MARQIKKPKRENRGNSYPETVTLKDGRYYINIEAYREFKLRGGTRTTIAESDFKEAEP